MKQENINFVMIKILEELVIMQNRTAPIHLSIGYTSKDNIVQHDAIIIKDAAPLVLRKIMELGEQYNLIISVSSIGVIISFGICKEIPIKISNFKK